MYGTLMDLYNFMLSSLLAYLKIEIYTSVSTIWICLIPKPESPFFYEDFEVLAVIDFLFI